MSPKEGADTKSLRFLFITNETARFSGVLSPPCPLFPGSGRLTFAEEGADHEAEGDGGDGKADQEDQHQRGVAVCKHRHVLLHLRGVPPQRSAHAGDSREGGDSKRSGRK